MGAVQMGMLPQIYWPTVGVGLLARARVDRGLVGRYRRARLSEGMAIRGVPVWMRGGSYRRPSHPLGLRACGQSLFGAELRAKSPV